jgi:hypothetical protein
MTTIDRLTNQNINLNNMRKAAIKYIRYELSTKGGSVDIDEVLELLGDHPSLPACCLEPTSSQSRVTESHQ